MATKKLKKANKTGKTEPKKSPQEFLASFINPKDRDFIEQSHKETIYHLYYVALDTPKSLRQNTQQTNIYLGFVAVFGEPDYEERINLLQIKEALLDILKQYGVVKDYKLSQRYDESTEKTFPPELLVFADIKFCPNEVISYFEDFKEAKGQPFNKASQGEPEFDSQNRVIRFGNNIYILQKERLRLRLFREFWEERMVVKNNKIKQKGTPFQPEAVALRIGITESSQKYNTGAKEKLNKLIKDINTNLRRKAMPIKITKRGGIQILVRI